MAILCGIDPGVNTGLAIWDSNAGKFLAIDTLNIVRAMRQIADLADSRPEIYIEDARKRKWIPREQNLSQFKGRAMGAGSIKRDCAIWEEFAIEYGLRLHLVPPRKGLTKWDADTFNRITGWTGRTSNHARDAALLVFGK